VGGWHDNDEGKDIINEGVEYLEKDISVIHDQHLYVQVLNFITLLLGYESRARGIYFLFLLHALHNQVSVRRRCCEDGCQSCSRFTL